MTSMLPETGQDTDEKARRREARQHLKEYFEMRAEDAEGPQSPLVTELLEEAIGESPVLRSYREEAAGLAARYRDLRRP